MSRADSPLRGRMIFNVGSRRSGTFWLQRIVAAHPEVAAVPSETHLFSHGLAPLFERFQHSLRSSSTVGTVFVEREAVLDAARDLSDVVFAGMLEPGTKRLAERTPMHVLHLRLMASIYPDARFVHIIRDGRDVARSIRAQEWGPQQLEEAAGEWREAILAARRADLSPTVYREVRYEQLLRDPEGTVMDLYTWLGLPTNDDVIADAVAEARIEANLGGYPSRIAAAGWRESYSQADLATFDRVAGDLLRELGYPASEASEPPEGPTRRPTDLTMKLRAGVTSIRRPRLGQRDRAVPTGPLQQLLERTVGGLQSGAPEEISATLTPDALVRFVTPEGGDQGRGEHGRALLRRLLQEGAFTGRQVRGDVYLAQPYAGIVLAYGDGGLRAERTIFVRFAGDRIGELIIYAT
jgi:hypothetical protein